MPAYLRSSLPNFLPLSDSEVLATLTRKNAEARFPLTPDAIRAWDVQLPFLKEGVRRLIEGNAAASNWTILLEYPIPQIGTRIDAVLLTEDIVIVIETKTGCSPTSARRQVEDYAISLACFHEASEGRTIVPVVVSDSKTAEPCEINGYERLVTPCRIVPTSKLGSCLLDISSTYVSKSANAIDPQHWDEARFKPIPPIIEAAVKLYAGMEVFEIGHAAAAREDLDRATGALVDVAELTKATPGGKAICFVTGVPGAGKTLVGLNAVHHSALKDQSMFLSGNGPLVKIIREALVRDVIRRDGITRRQAEHTLHAFIANVHRFADSFAASRQMPEKNVIVFDEAQRAWDQEQNARPTRNGIQRPPVSEPEMLLEIMDRRTDWAVVVALIGGGQEINKGEAGLSEWGRALQRFEHWKVYASDDVLAGKFSSRGFKLFEEPDKYPSRLKSHGSLHLSTSSRSIRATHISDWVDAVLAGDVEKAAAIANTMDEPPSLTRSLPHTREWLHERRIGFTRAGLVACASAVRLRADGIEASFDFHKGFEWERWFLDRSDCVEASCDHKYCSDVRASSKLEVCATQFEIQGLELDWIGMCWGEDLVWTGQQWRSQKFNSKMWTVIRPEKLPEPRRSKSSKKHEYRLNAYRVLLTRARQGMVIYVPCAPLSDSTRAHKYLDNTYEMLVASGATTLNSFRQN